MLHIAAIHQVEMIRDGGSFSASFVDDAGSECTLRFPVAQRVRGNAEVERLGHAEPFVARVKRFADDKTVGHSLEDVRPVSWDEALSLLEEIGPLIPETNVWSLRWYQEMIGVARRSGRPVSG
jgi:hypothetical protein